MIQSQTQIFYQNEKKYNCNNLSSLLKEFPSKIQFKYSWRNYQQRVLTELETHLKDNHLHIIAPPGSGKTILGLEVALRLNKPTLIVVPTIAIRTQWETRFVKLFLQTNQSPNWISHNIYSPKFLTIVTYQALHVAHKNLISSDEIISEEEIKTQKKKKAKRKIHLIKLFKQQHLGTIIVDEAHHLKNAWWESLNYLKEAINPTIVGLTATPPYDVSYHEWQRYIALNGSVDAEISIPELIVESNLCPHQDFIVFSSPTSEEINKIYQYRERIQKLFASIKQDTLLIQAIEQHPIIKNPVAMLHWIYSNLEYYSASLIYLHAAGKPISNIHLEIIGDKNYQIPELTYEWMEILLSFYLFKDLNNFTEKESHQEKLINQLKRNGVLEKTKINFVYNRKVNNYLSTSISKLYSIDKIVDFEYKQLGADLRMVILTDYIRKEFLVDEKTNTIELNKIGVISIFEQLRRSNNFNMRLAVLTGSIWIISKNIKSIFYSIAKQNGIDKISTKPIAYDDNYLIVSTTSANKHKIVAAMTQVFQEGAIDVLIGTKSLLGEGWDAPAINSLVLASFIGSYVLSNQMRGRAIRTEIGNKNKTGNIWHLACIDPTAEDGGIDFKLLSRRFKTFVGISFDEDNPQIENNLERLHIPNQIKGIDEIKRLNELMFEKASKRDTLQINWKKALKEGTSLVEEIKIPFKREASYFTIKSLYYNKTIKNLFAALAVGLSGFGLDAFWSFIKHAGSFRNTQELINWLLFTMGLGLLVFGKKSYNSLKTYIKYRDISKDVASMATALLETLINIAIIKTKQDKLEIITKIDDKGAIYCHLEGGSTFEKSSFIIALQELINPIENPKYVIIRKSYFLHLLSQKDYHAVPEIIGRKKEYALDFQLNWKKYVGSCQLIYTRTIIGRKLLLKSRLLSLSAQFDDKQVSKVNKWR
jgi:superfamily II DNA or RNA helicase